MAGVRVVERIEVRQVRPRRVGFLLRYSSGRVEFRRKRTHPMGYVLLTLLSVPFFMRLLVLPAALSDEEWGVLPALLFWAVPVVPLLVFAFNDSRRVSHAVTRIACTTSGPIGLNLDDGNEIDVGVSEFARGNISRWPKVRTRGNGVW